MGRSPREAKPSANKGAGKISAPEILGPEKKGGETPLLRNPPAPKKGGAGNPALIKKGGEALPIATQHRSRAERTSEARDAEQKSPAGKNGGPGIRAMRLGTTHRKVMCCAKPMDKRDPVWYTGKDRQSDRSPCLPAGYGRPSTKALQSWKRPTKAGSLSITSPIFTQEQSSGTDRT